MRTLDWFALPSVSGLRLVPSEQAPRFGRASAHPGIRVSHLHHLRLRSYDGHAPVFAGDISNRAHASENKKPSGALAREGPCETDCRYRVRRDRSHEPGMHHRSADSRSIVCWGFQNRVALLCSCSARKRNACEARGVYVRELQMSSGAISGQWISLIFSRDQNVPPRPM